MAFDSSSLWTTDLPTPEVQTKPISFNALLEYFQTTKARMLLEPLGPHEISDVTVLKAAKARLERGWCQRTVSDHQGGVCAMGAILSALQDREVPYCGSPAQEVHLERMARYFPHCMGMGDVIRINDDRCTTKRDMVNMFDRAIANAERGAVNPPQFRASLYV